MTTPQQTSLLALQGRLASNSLTAADQSLFTQALTSIIPSWGFGGSGAPPDLLGYGGQSDETNAREFFAILYAIAAGGSSGGGPVIPTSWTVPAWWIDPVAGSDLNNGTSALTPLKTWAQLVNLWGTNAPILAQNTVITFLSSQPDGTDPVIWRPVVRGGFTASIQGTTPTVVTAGVVLAGVVAKNRATNTLLQATLGATAALGQMVINTTGGKSSRAWIHKLVAGTTFSLSQPLAPMAVPQTAYPAEVDTFANGDTVNLVSVVSVNVVDISPVVADYNGAGNNAVYLYQLNVLLPGGAGAFSPARIGAGVVLLECNAQRLLSGNGSSQSGPNLFTGPSFNACVNVRNIGGLGGQSKGVGWALVGGTVAPANAVQGIFDAGEEPLLDGDIILSGPFFVASTTAAGAIGFIAVDTGCTLALSGRWFMTGGTYGGQAIYGGGGVNVFAGGHFIYPSGAGAAVANLLYSGGTRINGQPNAHSIISGSPDVLNGGISLTAAHLDAAAGAAGFGGHAFIPGIGSIANF
jgi:hypothetical protein